MIENFRLSSYFLLDQEKNDFLFAVNMCNNLTLCKNVYNIDMKHKEIDEDLAKTILKRCGK